MNTLTKLWKDERGASAAEYALILALVGTGIAVAAYSLGGAISTEMEQAKDCIAAANPNGVC
jgi:pilus assembly protein Flp/PilA